MSGLRYNKGKRRWSLIDYASLERMIEVLEYGAQKYSKDNWKQGFDKTEILESIQRHLASLFDGEALDKESGLHHIGHIMCNAMFYSYMLNKEKEEEQNGSTTRE